MPDNWISYIVNKDTFAMMIAAFLVLKTTNALGLLTKEIECHRAETTIYYKTLTAFVQQITSVIEQLNITSSNHTNLISELQIRKMERERERAEVK